MAGEDDIEVQVDDIGTVQVAVDDNTNVDPQAGQQAVESKGKTTTRTRTPRVSLDSVSRGPSPEEALAQAQAFAKQQEDARKAAEATAAAERLRADAAETARQTAVKEAVEHRDRANDSQLTLIESRIASAQSEIEALKDAYTRAAETGEFKVMGELQVKMSRASAALDRHEALKADLEANPQHAQTTEGAVAPPQVQSAIEQHLAQYSPAAQTWLRQHMDCLPPQFGGDGNKHNKMMAGHYAALAKGFAANSEPYFKEIESHIVSVTEPVQQQQATSKATEVQPAATEQRRASPAPAAPVSRDVPTTQGQPGRRTVQLSKDQQEMAKLSFPHLKEQEAYGLYARNLLELEAEGKIGRLTH